MYEELYEAVPDTKRFLERIGLKGFKPYRNLEDLNKLINAFKTHIPFENLTVWLERKVPSLAVNDLYDKMILHRRGGYCHEMNGLFLAFLKTLGFECYSVSVYVRENIDFLPGLGHRANICIIEGREYFVDVGYGGSSPYEAVPLDGTEAGGYFILEDNREYTVYKIVDDQKEISDGYGHFVEWIQISERKVVACKKTLMFRDFVAYPVEFDLPNRAIALDHDNLFNRNLYVNFANDKGEVYSIFNNIFKSRTEDGSMKRIIKDLPELKKILLEYFNIEI